MHHLDAGADFQLRAAATIEKNPGRTFGHRQTGAVAASSQARVFASTSGPMVARIADLWLPSTNVEDWCAGFRTAAVVAASQKGVYEVSAWASTALGKEGLSRAGFLLRRRSVVSLFGDARILEGRELHLQMLDSDASSYMGKPCPARPGLRSN